MITLHNSQLFVEVDGTRGCDILRVSNGPDGYNLLDKRGWQTWLKRGPSTDFSTSVLQNFYPESRTAEYTVVRQSDTELVAAWSTPVLRVEKTLRLKGASLAVETAVLNVGEEACELLQLEHFIQVAGGGREERAAHRTRIISDSDEEELVLENFSQRYVLSSPFDNTRLQILGNKLGAEWAASTNTERVACVVFGKVQARGFNSEKFTLQPGEAFTHQMQLRVLGPQEMSRSTPRRTESTIEHDVASIFTGEPVFEQRWSHLCLQYDEVRLDDLKKVVAEMLAPLGYNGVIFEVDRGVRTHSHPELSESWALSMAQLQEIVQFSREHGLQVGLEYNTPGHQNETNLLQVYPQFAEDPAIWDRPPLCVSHSGARQVVSDVIGELVTAVQPDLFHYGADEVQFHGSPTIFGRCERCRGRAPAQLFGEYLQWLTGLLPATTTQLIFGDMFLRDDQFGPNSGGNGSAGDVWQTLECLPPHLQISDWHYFPRETYPSLDFFRDKGYNGWPTVAFDFDGIRNFANYAQQQNVRQILHTTWAVPSQEKLPIESIVWAAFYFWLGRQADDLPVRDMALGFCRRFW